MRRCLPCRQKPVTLRRVAVLHEQGDRARRVREVEIEASGFVVQRADPKAVMARLRFFERLEQRGPGAVLHLLHEQRVGDPDRIAVQTVEIVFAGDGDEPLPDLGASPQVEPADPAGEPCVQCRSQLLEVAPIRFGVERGCAAQPVVIRGTAVPVDENPAVVAESGYAVQAAAVAEKERIAAFERDLAGRRSAAVPTGCAAFPGGDAADFRGESLLCPGLAADSVRSRPRTACECRDGCEKAEGGAMHGGSAIRGFRPTRRGICPPCGASAHWRAAFCPSGRRGAAVRAPRRAASPAAGWRRTARHCRPRSPRR